MTTNVFDGAVKVVATDSRWSWIYGPYVVYCDDTGFHKIQVLDDLVIMFAGRGDLIQSWRDYLATKPRILANQPAATKEVSICMFDAKTGEYVKSAGGVHRIVENSRFAGTGGEHACGCWVVNRNAIRAVETAKTIDPLSGGEVKFVDIVGNDDNLKHAFMVYQTPTIDVVSKALDSRGFVMKINDSTNLGTPVPFKVAAANDTALNDFKVQAASGQLPPSAPFEGMDREWSTVEKQEMNDALRSYGWE